MKTTKPVAKKRVVLSRETLKAVTGGAYEAYIPTVPCNSIGNPVTCIR